MGHEIIKKELEIFPLNMTNRFLLMNSVLKRPLSRPAFFCHTSPMQVLQPNYWSGSLFDATWNRMINDFERDFWTEPFIATSVNKYTKIDDNKWTFQLDLNDVQTKPEDLKITMKDQQIGVESGEKIDKWWQDELDSGMEGSSSGSGGRDDRHTRGHDFEQHFDHCRPSKTT